jgi:WD40-like Beta Propeller Repeat
VRLGVVLAAPALFLAGASHAGSGACPPAPGAGTLAFVRGTALHVFDLATCSDRMLVRRGVTPPTRWSPDGRWLAYGRGSVVSSQGGAVRHPLGSARWSGSWSARGELAGVTADGGVVVASPTEPAHTIFTGVSGYGEPLFDPAGRRIALPERSAIVVLDLKTGSRRTLYRVPKGRVAPPEPAAWSPDGRWLLFWSDLEGSASIAADGLPLEAVPVTGGPPKDVATTLVGADLLAWCGNRLVATVGRDRVSTHGKTLIATSAPSWRARNLAPERRLSWLSPACYRNRVVAASASPPTIDFRHPHRAIWLSGRQLTSPPPGASDERPRFTRNGFVLFVRTDSRGGTLELGISHRVRPLVRLGRPESFYGRYDWAARTDLLR